MDEALGVRSSGAPVGTGREEAGTASTGTCRQTWPQKSHRNPLQEEEGAPPLTVELTPCVLEASEARSTNRVHASVDSATDAGSDARGEAAEGPCGEAEGRWWGVEVVVVLVG